ncbi:hypothetical protein JZI27_13850 [Brevibacillus sp. AY1]|nr:hypothetical protein [Brevibacillus sp. AY1]
MKMSGIAMKMCLASMLLLAGCQADSIDRAAQQPFLTPPNPVIAWKEKSAMTVPTSFCWSVEDEATCTDTAAPPEIIAEKKPSPLQVQPGAVLTISYDLPPAEQSMVVTQWVGSSQIEQTLENGNQWKVPEQPGWYLFDVRAQWDQGDAGHAFVIEVKSNSRSQYL